MVLSRFLCRGIVLWLVLLVSACSTYTKPGGEPAPVEKRPDYTSVKPPATSTQPEPRPVEPATRAAYQPLLDKAGQATARGDYEQALALLERAQRIDPDSAEIYLNMAKTHKAKGDFTQARATAERGLLYCSGSAQCNALRAYTH
jgi:tetratricopeptide (TPR) repeat protein